MAIPLAPMRDFCKQDRPATATIQVSSSSAADMPSISPSLPLMFKAHVLGSVTARVALDAQRSSPRSFTAAMEAIRNAESKLARHVSCQTLPVMRLQEKALKLADLRCRLYNETSPLERATAVETVLTNVRNVQRHGSAGALMMAQLCGPEQVLLRRRDVLSSRFWAGELNQRGVFRQQVEQLVELERGYVPAGYPTEQIIHSIFNHLERACPQAPTFNPQSSVLARFRQDVLGTQTLRAETSTPA
ncbi:hypothetical protein [Stenotrophomonas maltophilia]|uniref:hypothetical protein n=1 Tax=Stenotrophomonas maltophilia TaxID=40324 RepID=UPI0013DC8E4A|nr:hypothetical protein [Stenotrophomonas maltophilia]